MKTVIRPTRRVSQSRFCAFSFSPFVLAPGLGIALAVLHGFLMCSAPAEIGVLFGSVTDLRGGIVAAAEVALYRVSWTGQEVGVQRVSVLRTDADGRFRFDKIPSGSYMVRAWLEGFATTRIWGIRVNPGQTRLLNIAVAVGAIAPAPPTTVYGEVRSSRGEPLPNVALTLRDGFNAGILVQTETDEEGRFTADLLFCGEYVISAFKSGFKLTAAVAGIECSRENKLNLSLERAEGIG